MSEVVLTKAQERMLSLLTSEPQETGLLGQLMWNKMGRRDRVTYARSASQILNRLREKGLARYVLMHGYRAAWTRA
jgi:hypothetical protein